MKSKQLALAFLAAGLVFGAALMADDPKPAEDKPAPEVYKALERMGVARYGTPVLYGNNADDVANGLNRLSRDGWELVAIEPGYTETLTPKAFAQHKSTYIFRRRE